MKRGNISPIWILVRLTSSDPGYSTNCEWFDKYMRNRKSCNEYHGIIIDLHLQPILYIPNCEPDPRIRWLITLQESLTLEISSLASNQHFQHDITLSLRLILDRAGACHLKRKWCANYRALIYVNGRTPFATNTFRIVFMWHSISHQQQHIYVPSSFQHFVIDKSIDVLCLMVVSIYWKGAMIGI